MKLLFILSLAITVVITTSCGENSTTKVDDKDTVQTNVEVLPDNTTVIEVPEPIKTSFATQYPNATNTKWRNYEPDSTFYWEWTGWPMMRPSDYWVTYDMDNQTHWSWYDYNNNWIGTVSRINDYTTLPSAVNNTIKNEFAGFTVTAVDKENDKNRTAYEIDLTKGDDRLTALIAENGTVLKKKGTINGVEIKDKSM
jgi:hypothetical protein